MSIVSILHTRILDVHAKEDLRNNVDNPKVHADPGILILCPNADDIPSAETRTVKDFER